MAGGGAAEVRESGSVGGLRSAAEALGAAETARLADFRPVFRTCFRRMFLSQGLAGARAV